MVMIFRGINCCSITLALHKIKEKRPPHLNPSHFPANATDLSLLEAHPGAGAPSEHGEGPGADLTLLAVLLLGLPAQRGSSVGNGTYWEKGRLGFGLPSLEKSTIRLQLTRHCINKNVQNRGQVPTTEA